MQLFHFKKGFDMAKGGSYENEIAKLLSIWWTGDREDVFGRSDASGARFTARRKAGKDTANQAGDLTFNDSVGEPLIAAWSIECKTGYATKNKIKDKVGKVIKKVEVRWDVLDFLDSAQMEPVLRKFWNQCKKDADLTNREPVLIFRRNRRKSCVAIRNDYFFDISMNELPCSFDRIDLTLQGGDNLSIFNLDDFLSWSQNLKKVLINNFSNKQ